MRGLCLSNQISSKLLAAQSNRYILCSLDDGTAVISASRTQVASKVCNFDLHFPLGKIGVPQMEFLTERFLFDRNDFSGPVLVTGAGGCIGAWVVAILARSGVNVIASDLSVNRRRVGLILGDTVNELVWEQCDVTNFSALKALAKKYSISAIIHLAGLQVPFCAAKPPSGLG